LDAWALATLPPSRASVFSLIAYKIQMEVAPMNQSPSPSPPAFTPNFSAAPSFTMGLGCFTVAVAPPENPSRSSMYEP